MALTYARETWQTFHRRAEAVAGSQATLDGKIPEAARLRMINPFAPPGDDGSGNHPKGSDRAHAEANLSIQTAASADYVVCEVCRLPHQRGVAICEDCRHVLGSAPEWSSIRGRRASYARQFALALVVVVLMLWLDVLAFGAAGFFILMAPVYWLFTSGYHYRAVSKSLRGRP